MRRFDDFHPIVVFVYYMAVLIPVMFFMSMEIALMAMVAGLIRIWAVEKKFPLSRIVFSVLCVLVMVIVNALVSHSGQDELFFINGKAITLQAVKYGAVSGLMLAAVYIWFSIFSKAVTAEKIAVVFRFMPKLGLIISLILRLVPMYVNRYRMVHSATRINTDKRSELKVTGAVFTYALEGSAGIVRSMEYRGFKKPKRRYVPFKIKSRDVIFLCIILIFQVKYLQHGAVKYILEAVFLLIPIIWEAREAVKWQFMKQKI